MNYNIHITKRGIRDLKEATDYIEFTLLNPQAADELLDITEETIKKLAFMPQKHSIIDDPVLKSWEIRMIPIKNYLALYIIKEETHTVHIIRFLYGKRNWQSILRNEHLSLD